MAAWRWNLVQMSPTSSAKHGEWDTRQYQVGETLRHHCGDTSLLQVGVTLEALETRFPGCLWVGVLTGSFSPGLTSPGIRSGFRFQRSL